MVECSNLCEWAMGVGVRHGCASGKVLRATQEAGDPALLVSGVSYGLTQPLYNFWSKSGFLPLYLRQVRMRACCCAALGGQGRAGQGQGLHEVFKHLMCILASAIASADDKCASATEKELAAG
jgi:hypothetical protein